MQQDNILEAFRVRYNGISLFHNFASDSEIMAMINQKYMDAKEKDSFSDDSVRMMPLMILNPDDNYHYSALDIAIN